MVIVSQLGGRHRYLIPRILFKYNLLTRLYTDTHSNSNLGSIVSKLPINKPLFLKKIKNRKILGIKKELIYSTDRLAFQRLMPFTESNLECDHRLFYRFMKNYNFGDAKILYRLSYECFDYALYAKSCGLKIITDMFISPLNCDIDYEEAQVYGGIYNIRPDNKNLSRLRQAYTDVINVSDILLCPSEFVAEGVLQLVPTAKEKIRIVPYGSSIPIEQSVITKRLSNKKKISSFIFVGTDAMRKGLHYYAETATIIRRSFPDIEFKVAGLGREGVFKHELFKDLTFLGKLNTEELKTQYINSDCLILPSLCEGLPGVLLEAMSLGVPIITTHSSGIKFKNAYDGFSIKERSTQDIVKTIKFILNNPEILKTITKNSSEKLSYFSLENWEKNLVQTIKELC